MDIVIIALSIAFGSVLGYLFLKFRQYRNIVGPESLSRTFNKKFATVYTCERGMHRVMLPSGVDIPHLISSVVVDHPGKIPVCTVSFICNISTSQHKALSQYKS